ncbi:hypothetical protein CLOAM1442 [Candidatus Cloacimonas acidaminovorans str. Evry]|uniref:Uncharacterized protein n=1 Tax=Cloacimonas acidaminovorans (strain Evry) TaxID=459349 RepID=B0VJ82_CLOAI|nr:hypothetical protein CLOAM1442 [Candidatus Cloacimonas acidaminovorans str. Evry]
MLDRYTLWKSWLNKIILISILWRKNEQMDTDSVNGCAYSLWLHSKSHSP